MIRTEKKEKLDFAEFVKKTKNTGTDIQVIPRVFENNQITQIMYKGQQVLIAKEVGRVLGYADDGRMLITKLSEWSDEFEEGIETIKLEGSQLIEFKSVLELILDSWISSHTRNLILLTESGVNKVLMKTNKPVGKRLRKWLARDVLPSLRKTGSYQLDSARTKSDKQRLAQQRADTNVVSEIRKAMKDFRIGYDKRMQHCKSMCKNSPTADKAYWRTAAQETDEDYAKRVSNFETIMMNLHSFQKLLNPSNAFKLTEGDSDTPIDNIKSVPEKPKGYYTVNELTQYLHGTQHISMVMRTVYAIKYYGLDADADHCVRVAYYDKEGNLRPFYVYDKHVLTVLERNKGTRLA